MLAKNFFEGRNTMEYPNLLLAIRGSGRPQYEIARMAGLRESRLSEIVRRGAAKPAERRALSRVLGAPETHLFGEVSRRTEAP